MTSPKTLFWLKRILRIFCYATLVIGIYFTISMFYTLPPSSLSIVLAFGIAQISGFLIILYLLTTLLLLKLTPKTKEGKLKREEDVVPGQVLPHTKNHLYQIIFIIGISLSLINCLPLLSTPIAIDTGSFSNI